VSKRIRPIALLSILAAQSARTIKPLLAGSARLSQGSRACCRMHVRINRYSAKAGSDIHLPVRAIVFLFAALLSSACVEAQTTAFSNEFRGYSFFPGAPLADVVIGGPVGPDDTVAVVAISYATVGNVTGWATQYAATTPDLRPQCCASTLEIAETIEPPRLHLCESGPDTRVVVLAHSPPAPRFRYLEAFGPVTVFGGPSASLNVQSTYDALACSVTPQAVRVFAHQSSIGNVQAYRFPQFGPPFMVLEDGGVYWFNNATDVSMIAKRIEATAQSNRFWVFASALAPGAPTENRIDLQVAMYTDIASALAEQIADTATFHLPSLSPDGSDGFSAPCPIVSGASVPAGSSTRFAVTLTGENSAVVLHAVGDEVKLTRVADLLNCAGIASQTVPFPVSGTTFNFTGLAMVGEPNALTLVGPRLVHAIRNAGGDYSFDDGIEVPPIGSGGSRAALDVGRALPIVAGPDGATGLRVMGDALTILIDGFE